jgi:hypothetical protein
MLNIFDIANNVSQFKEPTVLKYLIKGDKKQTLSNIQKNTKPIITMHDTKKNTSQTTKK